MDILLIPGFMLDGDLWTEIRPSLSALGRVIEADTTLDDSLVAMADRAIASLDEPALVLGFSMGGYVARQIAYRAPEKVRGLVLAATSSVGMDPGATVTEAMVANFHQLGRASILRSLHPDHRSDALIARVQAMSRRLGGAVFRRQSGLMRADDTARLGEIGCPTLVVAAGQDELRSIEESRALHRGISGSAFTVIDRSGHLIPLEQPQALVEAVHAQPW